MKRKEFDDLCVLFEKRMRVYSEEDSYWSIHVVNSGMGSITFLKETLERYQSIKCSQIQEYINEYIQLMKCKLDISAQIRLFQLVLKIDTFLIENANFY